MRWFAALLLLLPAGVRDDARPGLVGEYFNVGQELKDFPFIEAGRKPLLRRLDAPLVWEQTDKEFALTGLWDYFYVRWSGLLKVPGDGEWTFTLESDDGSRLWIGGKVVVDNGGLHAMVERSGKVDLKAGLHEIRVELFENDDKAGLKLSWEGPGEEKRPIPASAFFHRKDPELDRR
jgi:hypothetical protein